MVTTSHDGGATRYVSAGTHWTRSADRTRPAAPRCATHPVASASRVDTIAAGTTAIPAICATPINGIARKFSARPANVTRENASAPTGNSMASAAADAANMATAGRAIKTFNVEYAELAEP